MATYTIKTTDGSSLREQHTTATAETVRDQLEAVSAYLQRDDATVEQDGEDFLLRGEGEEVLAHARLDR